MDPVNRLLIRSHFVNPLSPGRVELVRDGLLVVTNEGRIEDFGDHRDVSRRYPGYWIQDFRDRLILPGFVDLHTHLPQYEAIGMDGVELMTWLERYIFRTEDRFMDPEYAIPVIDRFFNDLLAEGTTTAVILGTVHREATELIFQKAIDCRIQAIIGKVMMDRNAPRYLLEETDVSLDEADRICAKYHNRENGRVRYAFTPRFSYNCSMELMKGAAALAARHGAYIQTHLSENRSSIAKTMALFPGYRDYTDIYAKAGLLGPKTILAHAIYLDANEVAALAGAGCAVAHCPSSNLFLKSGIMDLRQIEGARIPVGLGSDVGAGPNLSLFSEMHSAVNASKARSFWDPNATVLTPEHAVYLATLGGARALGLDGETGNFAKGKWADFVVADYDAIDPTGLGLSHRETREVLSLLVYRGKKDIVRRTYVRGKRAHG